MIKIYTDGSYSPKRKLGAWATFIQYGSLDYETRSGLINEKKGTTNQRAELIAAIKALSTLKSRFGEELREKRLFIFTDSTYLVNGITKWIFTWLEKDWKTSVGENVKNKDLWKGLLRLSKDLDIKWVWIRGHHGNLGNHIVDALAKFTLKDYMKASKKRG